MTVYDGLFQLMTVDDSCLQLVAAGGSWWRLQLVVHNLLEPLLRVVPGGAGLKQNVDYVSIYWSTYTYIYKSFYYQAQYISIDL